MKAKSLKTFIPLLFTLLLSNVELYGQSLVPAEFPSLVSSLNVETSLEFCYERVPLKEQDVRERFEKELLLSLWDRPQVILWLKRSTRYLPHIEKALKESGMPDDLKYIAIAESALRPHAGSSKGAIGFWQFLEDTGRKHGLVIDEYLDERRSVFASTRAAIQYFTKLMIQFKSWTLAAAAYNMGEEGLTAEILEQGTENFYDLYLPLETQRYIFRILSVKLIFSDPERYGFVLAEEDFYPPLIFDRIHIECSQEIPIRIIADAAKIHFKEIKDLNPEIRGHYLAKGKHEILVPEGASKGFQSRYKTNLEKYSTAKKKRIYVVKSGDNLSSIADRFGAPLSSLLIWNRIDIKDPIHPGDRLTIYNLDANSDRGEK
jgi:membrane-bound lytic murein transglycosylase D